MLDFISAVIAAIAAFFRSRIDTAVEILALHQQVAVLTRAILQLGADPPQ